MTLKSLIALVVSVAWTGAALPATPAAEHRHMSRTGQSADQRFDQLDTNHDGFLSRDEANDAPELETRFSELDANNDGKLSRSEYRVVTAGEAAALPGASTAASGATRP
jgi:Ca2+-binding EF-hand superfamily protein